MNFYSMRDLRTESRTMWADLDKGDEVVLTNNGKPSALVINIPDGCFDETVQAVRQARAMIALNSARQRAAREGFMSDDEINDIISEVRGQGPHTDWRNDAVSQNGSAKNDNITEENLTADKSRTTDVKSVKADSEA